MQVGGESVVVLLPLCYKLLLVVRTLQILVVLPPAWGRERGRRGGVRWGNHRQGLNHTTLQEHTHCRCECSPSGCKVLVHLLPPLPHHPEQAHGSGDIELLYSTPFGGQCTSHGLQGEWEEERQCGWAYMPDQ